MVLKLWSDHWDQPQICSNKVNDSSLQRTIMTIVRQAIKTIMNVKSSGYTQITFQNSNTQVLGPLIWKHR